MHNLCNAQCVLCVQPHYDDNDIGAGGTIAALSAAGVSVVYLTVTDDLVGVLDASLAEDEARQRLREEQRRAGEIIGVQQHYWLEYADAGPIDYYALRRDIAAYIRRLRPDYVFTVDPWLPYEAHQDHILTGRAVAEAAILYHLPRFKTLPEVDAAYQLHVLRGVVFYLTHAPNIFYDISSTVEIKHHALQTYCMQFTDMDMRALLEKLTKTERQCGERGGVERAEALKVLDPAQLHIHLNV
ncbi:MAG: PIG-L family deacetylase [Anaerolineae bacterium]|nr:PIG-L family deacetylase [Anaerolineae bacterium]